MELVYLWVEDYKNIKEQGFNFNQNILTSKNLNITALVGENGSGKSTIIEALFLSLLNKKPEFTHKFYIIFKDNDVKFIYFTPTWDNNEKKQIKTKKSIFEEKDINELKPYILHYNYALDTFSSTFNSHVLSGQGIYSSENEYNILSQPSKNGDFLSLKQINLDNQKIMTNVTHNFNKNIDDIMNSIFNENAVNFVPHTFKLILNINYYSKFFDTNKFHKTINNYMSYYGNSYKIENLLKIAQVYFILKLYELKYYQNLYIIDNEYLIELHNDVKERFPKAESIEEIEGEPHFGHFTLTKVVNKSEIRFYETYLNDDIKEDYPSLYKMAWYIRYIMSNQKKSNTLFYEPSNLNHAILQELLQNLPGLVEIEFWNENNVSYSDLSYGEKVINRIFYNLFYHINLKKHSYKNFTIILDEIEIGLHPDWQRKLLNLLRRICNTLIKKFDVKIHLILVTHSPFILSDLHKDNIIFLKNGEEIQGLDKKQTFGANIHTLLSDGFFMKDGLMGEFAKGKIDEIKRFYDENKDLKQEDISFQVKKDEFERKKKSFHHIQSIIGEPFLQTVIKNYLDELEIIFNGKKEFLDKEIQRLQDMRSQL